LREENNQLEERAAEDRKERDTAILEKESAIKRAAEDRQEKDDAIKEKDAVIQERDAAIKKAEEIQAKLDALLKQDPVDANKQHLKLLALQPPGMATNVTNSFPSTKEHFDLLRSLGKDRQPVKIVFQVTQSKPCKTLGVELHFKNG